MKNFWLAIFSILLGLYGVFSFIEVDPNLVLSSHTWFWQFQEAAWQIGYHQQTAAAIIYGMLVFSLFLVYVKICLLVYRNQWVNIKTWIWVVVSVLILSLSYPALSHDVFNYIFNAKMLSVYKVDPHVHVALEFPTDPWLKIMNNTHTPAPYAKGFTYLSQLFYFLGQDNVKLELLSFRLMMIIGFGLSALGIYKLLPDNHKNRWLLFALNPLILIENISNIHNDLVMMCPIIWMLVVAKQKNSFGKYLIMILLLLISVEIKYVTIILPVSYLAYRVLIKRWPKLRLMEVNVLTLLAPLLTTRSQRFLPWYLTWSLSLLPLITHPLVIVGLVALTLSGLLAYIPYLATLTYNQNLLLIRTVILFSIPMLTLLGYVWIKWIHHEKK